MRISRIVVKNFRSLQFLDVPIDNLASVVVSENNTGKSNLLHAIRLCLDVTLSSGFRALTKEDIHSDVDQTKPFQVLVGVSVSIANPSNPSYMALRSLQTERASFIASVRSD